MLLATRHVATVHSATTFFFPTSKTFSVRVVITCNFHEYSHPNSHILSYVSPQISGNQACHGARGLEIFWVNCLETPQPLIRNLIWGYGLIWQTMVVWGMTAFARCVSLNPCLWSVQLSANVSSYPLFSIFVVHKCHGTIILSVILYKVIHRCCALWRITWMYKYTTVLHSVCFVGLKFYDQKLVSVLKGLCRV